MESTLLDMKDYMDGYSRPNIREVEKDAYLQCFMNRACFLLEKLKELEHELLKIWSFSIYEKYDLQKIYSEICCLVHNKKK